MNSSGPGTQIDVQAVETTAHGLKLTYRQVTFDLLELRHLASECRRNSEQQQ